MDNSIEIIPTSFVCKACGTEINAPKHCGKAMNLIHEETSYWVCWKGEHQPCCGRESKLDYNPCCETPELTTDTGIESKNILL